MSNNTTQRSELEHHATKIWNSREDFLQIGKSLRVIRDKCLYRACADTFESFCYDRWEWSRTYAYQYIWALEVVEGLEAAQEMYSRLYIPEVKSHAVKLRPLAPEQRIAVAKELFECEEQGEHITNTVVDRVINYLFGSDSENEIASDLKAQTRQSEDAFPKSQDAIATQEAAVTSDEAKDTDVSQSVSPHAKKGKVSLSQMPAGFSLALPRSEEKPENAEGTLEGHLVPWPADETGILQRIRAVADAAPDATMSRVSTLGDMAAWTWSPIVPSIYEATEGLPNDEPLDHAALVPARLKLPRRKPTKHAPSSRESFVIACPDVDLFHPFIPDIALDMVMHYMKTASDWHFIVLTHCTDRLISFSAKNPLPENVLIGVVAKTEKNVKKKESVLNQVQGGMPWIYIKKPKKPVTLSANTNVRWVVIEAKGVAYELVSGLIEGKDGLEVLCRRPLVVQQRAWPTRQQHISQPAPKPCGSTAPRNRAPQKAKAPRLPVFPAKT